ncbi:beta-ketoacyl-ACP synthase II [Pararhizobium antarcticum]|uniref:3-oxoacyl-[acyl-carrier-protein] synthase 2 n=1 Tax=Pararhizobium antarcticum TaxID=1798805 RepID=A0A657M1S0_9HYPH|nr:beta-ketoacyl-ACP synthase II [Pararhizobium antarcticum]OJF94476.1 beta-ketoacyl-[acyl-carrier-protein] synthase II [Rhizobium sp. 58]OJG00710.1 beta-ketoacyl-[acyl-carrier-protein] synthase II [Pararhizobium antarcticum]
MRRVVITGTGMVSPLGCGTEVSWARLLDGHNAARQVTEFQVDDLPAKIACRLPFGDGSEGTFNPDDWMEPKEQRKVDDFIIYAMAASEMALKDADWHPKTDEDQIATGVMIGSGIGGLEGIVEGGITLRDRGPRRLSPFFIPGRLINLASGQVSIRHKLRGPNHSVVTACSTGAHAIGDAARLIGLGDADVMVAGGTESPISRIALAGFAACKALSTRHNDDPKKASRPYDKDRDGFVMGEGAGIVVLEELEHALARGARIYAEVVGYGMSGDAYHITAPSEDGDGAYRCMKMALKRAGLEPSDIDYINAHGTSTMADTIELGAVERLLGDHAGNVSMSSTKSAIGHLLGAAGAVEAIFCILAIRDNIAPPTLNLDNPSVETKIDLVPHAARKRKIDVALSNSFGFGGTNASLVLRRYEN